MRKKKTVIAFLMLIVALYSAWNTIKGISQEFNIPIPMVLIAILILYIFWKEEED